MQQQIVKMLRIGLSPAEVVDYLAIQSGYSQGDWADIRGVGRQAVNNNVKRAERKLAAQNTR